MQALPLATDSWRWLPNPTIDRLSKFSSPYPTLTTFLALAIFCVLTTTVFGSFVNASWRKTPLPPGPPADPIIGHLRSIPSTGQSELFHEWAKVYGDVMYLNILGRNIVVLDSIKAAHDLLEKRGLIYSCRPRLAVLVEILGWNPCLPFLQYGKSFLKHRRLFQSYFGSKECLAFIPMQTEEARVLVRNLAASPENHHLHIFRFSTAIIMQVITGQKITSEDDTLLKLAAESSRAVNSAGPVGNTPVDFFPWLKYFPSWFPGTYYANKARFNREVVRKMHDYPAEIVQKQLADGTAGPSFIADQLQLLSSSSAKDDTIGKESDTDMSFHDIRGAAAAIYGAGSDTTAATLSLWLFLMILHPECQRRAQKEIDEVIGPDRLPEYSDRASLPYVECMLQEVFRWHPIVPFAIPHRVLQDDIYEGMFIPKGSVIIGNVRGMSLDENSYTDPKTFNPSRFMPKPEGLGEPYFANPWGFGRRICPGRFLADSGLWIVIATILATVDIVKAKDENGIEIVPENAFTDGLVSQPVPFKCGAVPRDGRYKKMIEESMV